MCFTTGRMHLLLALHCDKGSKKAAAALANAKICIEMLDEMPWLCSRNSARSLEKLLGDWNPQNATASPEVREPAITLDAQALDPHSDLAKQLRALGWQPPPAAQDRGPAFASQLAAREASSPILEDQVQQDQPPNVEIQPELSSSPAAQLSSAALALPALNAVTDGTSFSFSSPISSSMTTALPPNDLSVYVGTSSSMAWPLAQSPPLPPLPTQSWHSPAVPVADVSMLALFESQAAFGMPVAGGWAPSGYGGLTGGLAFGQQWDGFQAEWGAS